MVDFAGFLSNYWIKTIGFPVISVMMISGVKIISRKDHALSITRNDLNIGMNLIITGLIILLNHSVKLAGNSKYLTVHDDQVANANNLLSMIVMVLLYTLIAVILSVVIRLFGWKKENENELNVIIGLLIPFVIGCFLLVAAANFTNK